MKGNIIILHGTGADPQYMWYPWLKKQLEDKGFVVSVPALPNLKIQGLRSRQVFLFWKT